MYIYGITEPNNKQHIYIGFTTKPLEERLKVHIYHSKKRKTHVANWIRKIMNDGIYPNIFLIKKTNKKDWKNDETNEINKHRKSHLISLNISDGGESPMLNKKHTKESLEKMSKSHLGQTPWNKGKKLSQKEKNKISKGLLGNQNTLGYKHNKDFKEKCRKKMTENSPNALNENKVKQIKKLINKLSVAKIANKFRVGETTIYRIKNNQYRVKGIKL
jgi:group I intron endonuclease